MAKFNVEPAEQRVLILPDIEPDKIGHIWVPDTTKKETPKMGTVIKTGRGSIDHPMEYLMGQKVVFSTYSGSEIELDLGDGLKIYLIMNQMDIWMKVTEIID